MHPLHRLRQLRDERVGQCADDWQRRASVPPDRQPQPREIGRRAREQVLRRDAGARGSACRLSAGPNGCRCRRGAAASDAPGQRTCGLPAVPVAIALVRATPRESTALLCQLYAAAETVARVSIARPDFRTPAMPTTTAASPRAIASTTRTTPVSTRAVSRHTPRTPNASPRPEALVALTTEESDRRAAVVVADDICRAAAVVADDIAPIRRPSA